jgi:hypothetical protein
MDIFASVIWTFIQPYFSKITSQHKVGGEVPIKSKSGLPPFLGKAMQTWSFVPCI